MALLIIAATGLLTLLAAPALPLAWRFSAALILSIPQLYLLPVGDFYLSLAFISTLLLWPEAIKEAPTLLRQKIILSTLGLFIIQAISLLWSTDLRLGLRTLAYAIPFFLIAGAAFSASKRDPRFVYITLSITTGVMIFEALMVVAFRLYPELEMAYFQSSVSGPLSGPNVIASLLDDSGRNNVLDPEKAGGIFVNANIAASYLGMGAFIAFTISRINKSLISLITALLLWVSALFTGSKAGIILAFALPLSAMAFYFYRRHAKDSRSIILAIAWSAAPIILTFAVFSISFLAERSAFAAASIDTASIRLEIWNYAAKAFVESPILGQGYGGWQQGYGTYALTMGIAPGFPPHNTLIYLWSQSGILAAALGLMYMLYVMRLAYQLAVTDKRNTKLLGLTLGMAAAWLFIQGMGENYGHLGDARQQPILAALIGLAYASLRRQHVNNNASAQFIPKPPNTQTNPT